MGPGLRRIYFSLPAGGCSTGRRPISIVIMDFEEEAAAVRFERAMHGPGRPAGIGAGGEALAALAGGIVADSQIAFDEINLFPINMDERCGRVDPGLEVQSAAAAGALLRLVGASGR